ncbi:LysR family transcriptional regulator [Enterococcus gilvus]|uniref:HTH lysR-type domain-containing protein n=1 Tax=Enterococcus gilvus ATCC BAA-350 TaxID=1158614 RepID=R2XC70_9ENTE|nr:LysR family transcriptional regulator [Enterococcus gilvus]EOI52188.1 hypothetical protein UKC_04084 [Enterococcus gilvus ATCC BAA-350]EOW78455.1 hypothetical protein I592_04048 [Enterococcus gilvus ATCC BAA-350]
MELRQLRYFIEIVNSQNYSNAAKNLFITQPTLSWNMGKLQSELGTKLLYQVGNKVFPTTSGIELYKGGLEIIHSFDSLINSIEGSNNTSSKELVIGSNAIIFPSIMPLIQEFKNVYPSFSISIEEAGSIKIQEKVVNEEIELGIVSLPVVEPGLEIEQNIFSSFHYDAYLLMRANHRLAHSKTIDIKELKSEIFCSMNKDYVLWHMLKEKARENGFQPEIRLESNNHDVLVEHIIKYNSIAILPVQLKKTIAKEDKLVWIPIKNSLKPFNIVVIYKRNKPLSPIAASCLEIITDYKFSN